jgi:endoplasmic reticulum resident protein 44
VIAVTIASQYRINKYPTLKLFRNGQMVKKEYRGQRSADSLANFIREELRDPVVEHNTLESMDGVEVGIISVKPVK